MRRVVKLIAAATIFLSNLAGQDPATVKSFLVKLSVPVSTGKNKPGDRIRAAIISPEILLNGYLEGTVAEAAKSKLVLKFNNVLYKGKSTPIESEVIGFVNSKGHKSVDDDERPVKLQSGVFLSNGTDLWLDEGAELRVQAR